MRVFGVVLAILMSPVFANADAYILGSGRWTCGEAVRVFQAGSDLEKGQLAGWILGFWSAATFERDTAFIDTVERAGGIAIANATIERCRGAGDTPVFRVVQGMIRNTK